MRVPSVRRAVSACASRWLTAISGLPCTMRDRLGHGQADDHAADQARSGRRGDAVEGGESDLRLAHRLGDDGIKGLDMGAGGDFRAPRRRTRRAR